MFRLTLALVVLAAPGPVVRAAAPPDAWPAFRGTGDSTTAAKQLPLKWSATDNIAWTADLPGYGQSSPVVWKDRVFVTAVEGEFKDTLHLLCLDLGTGRERWRKTFAGTQKVKTSDYVSKAAPTPVVTADRVFALFEGGDLFALDHAGKELWQRSLVKDFGPFTNNHGLGSSPVPAGDALLILVAQDKGGYLLAVETGTGKDRWKADGPFASSWASPTVLAARDRLVAVVSSAGAVAGYDVKSGERLWELGGLKGNTVASPTVAGGVAVVGSSERGMQVGVWLDTKGTADRVAWRADGATCSFGSPLVYDGVGYTVSREGVLYAFDPATGKAVYDVRVPGSCWASPVGGAGRVYAFTQTGACVVLKAGREQEVLAENKLAVKGRVYGVAAVEGAFLVRTGTALIRIGK